MNGHAAKAGSQREIDIVPRTGLAAAMTAIPQLFAALVGLLTATLPAAAMVGGATPAGTSGRSAVMIVGSRGTSCTAVALAPELLLTAAHCALAGADYKLVEFDAAHRPALKDISNIARHPGFDPNAVLRHQVTADVALLRLATAITAPPVGLGPANLPVAVGDRFVVIGYGLAIPGEGKSGGIARAATLVATGQPGTLQFRLFDPSTQGERAGLGACTGDSGAPVLPAGDGPLAVIGVVSWSTGPNNTAGCGGLTGVTPLARYRDWIIESARKFGTRIGN
jgi:hypothetical protein